MIEWQDDGIVLTQQPHGEDAALVQVLTRSHGRYAGLVRGGQSRRNRGVYEPGNIVRATWRARLSDHLGCFKCETVASPVAQLLADPHRLLALAAATSLLAAVLPERAPYPATFAGTHTLLDMLGEDHWAEMYVQWEILLLGDLGFALDFRTCAGGGNDRLAYVSPRTGRAVSLSVGAPYRDRLLPLPGFLIGESGGGPWEVAQGLFLTAHFLRRHVFQPMDRDLPAERQRLATRLALREANGVYEPIEPSSRMF